MAALPTSSQSNLEVHTWPNNLIKGSKVQFGVWTFTMKELLSISVSSLTNNLTCVLCGGYYIDATAITGCLHTFCKSCIIQYFEMSPYCPVCDKKIPDSDYRECLRCDTNLQNLVYKLIPRLHENELKRRMEFITLCQNSSDSGISETSTNDGSIGSIGNLIEERKSCLCLIYNQDGKDETRYRVKNSKAQHEAPRRYIHCSSMLTVDQAIKFIRYKFSIPPVKICLRYSKKILPGHFTMEDVALIYSIKPNRTIKLYFTLYDGQDKPIKMVSTTSSNQLTEAQRATANVRPLSPIMMEGRQMPVFMETPEIIRSTKEDRKRLESIRREIFSQTTGSNISGSNVDRIISNQVAVLTNLLLNKTDALRTGEQLNERLRGEDLGSSSSCQSNSGERATCDSTLNIDVTTVSEQNLHQHGPPQANSGPHKKAPAPIPPLTEAEDEGDSRYLSQVIIIKKRKNDSHSEEPRHKKVAIESVEGRIDGKSSEVHGGGGGGGGGSDERGEVETVDHFSISNDGSAFSRMTDGLANHSLQVKVEPRDEFEEE